MVNSMLRLLGVLYFPIFKLYTIAVIKKLKKNVSVVVVTPLSWLLCPLNRLNFRLQ